MKSYSRSQYADDSLLSIVSTRVALDRDTTAELLADLGEIDARKLYVPLGYESMSLYCQRELLMSEDTALRRIAVARTAREFTSIYPAVADGRLHLTAVLLLTPYLSQSVTPEAADELLAVAAHRSKAELRLLLAERFPKPDVPTLLQAIAGPAANPVMTVPPTNDPVIQLAPERVGAPDTPNSAVEMGPLSSRARLDPLSPGRFALHVTIDEETHEALGYAQSLLGHSLPSGDLATLLKRAAQALVQVLEKRKFGKCARPRLQKGVAKGRHIPVAVKRAVWDRDGGRCTFVGDKGKRCEAHGAVEFDHIEAVARGGESTVGNLRLRCRAHNQYEAECAFGSEFMAGKREQAREVAAQAQAIAVAEAKAIAETKAQAAAKAHAIAEAKAQAAAEAASQEEVIPWLRALGCNTQTAKRATERCVGMVGAPLEQRVFVACQGLGPRSARRALPVGSAPS